ncbi:hypothetical protein OIU84_002503 [Salix udensis]|uniref:Uncharacterized protein n=1 Tax=Salix udensis TaxID=889485 RepID=A0AAD6K6D2_9ROSI|nr:hypothetical protein OIU84_002503 [Salix udensis]
MIVVWNRLRWVGASIAFSFPSKRKLASKSVMEALVRVPQILARVPQNLLLLSFWDGQGGAALQTSLFFFSFCMKRSLIVIELGRCSVRSLSVRPVALHLEDH